jgi:hypothetical protein
LNTFGSRSSGGGITWGGDGGRRSGCKEAPV